jgi:DNA-directed RNA polymerase specialized sigma24 family protein
VLDYVSQKAEMYELERQLNAWTRKVEIAEMEAVSVKAIEKRMHLALKSLREQIDGI